MVLDVLKTHFPAIFYVIGIFFNLEISIIPFLDLSLQYEPLQCGNRSH